MFVNAHRPKTTTLSVKLEMVPALLEVCERYGAFMIGADPGELIEFQDPEEFYFSVGSEHLDAFIADLNENGLVVEPRGVCPVG